MYYFQQEFYVLQLRREQVRTYDPVAGPVPLSALCGQENLIVAHSADSQLKVQPVKIHLLPGEQVDQLPAHYYQIERLEQGRTACAFGLETSLLLAACDSTAGHTTR